jgi:hypothetical protein
MDYAGIQVEAVRADPAAKIQKSAENGSSIAAGKILDFFR